MRIATRQPGDQRPARGPRARRREVVDHRHREDDDYRQAGDLYRLMSQDERARLAANLAAPLAAIDRTDIVERFIAHLRAADEEYGERVEQAVAATRG